MHTIDKILSVQKKVDRLGKTYYRTTALVDQEECIGWSTKPDEYKVGDKVMSFFDDKYHTAKMSK